MMNNSDKIKHRLDQKLIAKGICNDYFIARLSGVILSIDHSTKTYVVEVPPCGLFENGFEALRLIAYSFRHEVRMKYEGVTYSAQRK